MKTIKWLKFGDVGDTKLNFGIQFYGNYKMAKVWDVRGQKIEFWNSIFSKYDIYTPV
jgi:hypothetical protein